MNDSQASAHPRLLLGGQIARCRDSQADVAPGLDDLIATNGSAGAKHVVEGCGVNESSVRQLDVVVAAPQETLEAGQTDDTIGRPGGSSTSSPIS